MSNIEEYTKNFKFMIPDFNVATWHTEIKENFVAIDALIANFVQAQQFQGAWKQVTLYHVGDLVYIGDKDSVKYGGLYKILVEHTTSGDNFDTYLSQHPEYYKLQGEMGAQEAALISQDWAIKDDGIVLINNAEVDYSAKAYAVGGVGTERNNAKYFKERADEYQQQAYQYQQEAHNSENKAGQYLEQTTDALNSAQNQAQIATNQAQLSTTYAQQSNDFALTSQNFAQQAQQSAEDAASSAAVSNPPPLLTHSWEDHILNDIRYLRADTFSWQNGEFYKSAYEHLVEDYNSRIKNSNGTTYYAWYSADSSYDNGLVYTLSETPSAGDEAYRPSNGTYIWGGDIHSVLDNNTTLLIDGKVRYTRSAENDILPDAYTETIGSQTITYYQAEDGHKIVLPDQESVVQAIYEETGVAWYYILDIENKRFKLPRTKYGFVGLRDTVGKYVPESVPNITGNLSILGLDSGYIAEGAFSSTTTNSNSYAGHTSKTAQIPDIRFKASDSSSTYQDNAPVQQRATQMYLYFYVGNYTKSAIEQTAGLNSELFNGKMDRDMSNMNASQTAKETVVGWGMPNYSALVTKTDNTPYTAESNGYIIWQPLIKRSYNKYTLTIDGQAVGYGGNEDWTNNCLRAVYPVQKGKTYSSSGSSYFAFCPAVGG